jgi:hypothetical protein
MRLRFMTLPPESAAEVANATTRRPPPPSPKRGIAPSPIQRLRRTTDAALKKEGRVEPAAIRIPSAQRPVQQSNIPDSYWDASGAPPSWRARGAAGCGLTGFGSGGRRLADVSVLPPAIRFRP